MFKKKNQILNNQPNNNLVYSQLHDKHAIKTDKNKFHDRMMEE